MIKKLLVIKNLFNKLKSRDKGVKAIGKISFLINVRLFLGAREKVFSDFKIQNTSNKKSRLNSNI